MRALIFGCGYLGQRVATTWIAAGYEVSALTRSDGNAAAFRQAGIQPFVGDICEPNSLSNLPTADIVLHAIGFDRKSGRTQEEVTCGGVRNILDAISNRCRQFIQISSTSVYGQSGGEWVDENSDCVPTQPGGMLNLMAEQLVLERFRRESSSSANVLRLAGIYGPGRLLSRVEAIRARVPLAGRGDSWLNLIHVDDAVAAIVACAAKGESSATYNVVDDHPIERREYFELLAQLIDAPAPTFNPSQNRDRGSGGLNKRCSNRKLRDHLDWMPKYPSIASGLPHAVGVLMTNRNDDSPLSQSPR